MSKRVKTSTTTTVTTKKTTTQSKSAPKSIEKNTLDLIIDSKMNEGDEGIFYLLPSEMSKSGLLNPEKFDSCTIRNVHVDEIRPSALLGIYSSLKPNGHVTVILSEPIAVMQPYEAKMVESNAKLAGFDNVKTSPSTFFNDFSNKEDDTLKVTFTKPGRYE